MTSGARLRADYAIDALVAEVERRRRLPGGRKLSYGRLVACTSAEERARLARAYRRRRGRGEGSLHYIELTRREALQREKKRMRRLVIEADEEQERE